MNLFLPFDDAASPLRPRLAILFAFLIGANAVGWALGWQAFHGRPLLMGALALAYLLGIRHAFDADHIAAIDNTVRKLRQEDKAPISAGLFFALGHSTIVILASGALAALSWHAALAPWRAVAGMVGTLVSGVFLLGIGTVNLLVLRNVWRNWLRSRRGEKVGEDEVAQMQIGSGPVARAMRRSFGIVSRSWHLYPIGFLFGLGFDTASEIALVGLAAQQTMLGVGPAAVMLFPFVFTLGMTLMDTLDSALMTGAYGWACVSPERKLAYNLVVTAVSVGVALSLGAVEVLGLLNEHSAQWPLLAALIGWLGSWLTDAGFALVGLLVGFWALGLILARWQTGSVEANGRIKS